MNLKTHLFSPQSEKLPWPWAVSLGFLVFFLLLAFSGFHETWRDEFQAWLIASNAGNFKELLANQAYEGQPLLWHLLLWIISKAGLEFSAVQLMNILIPALSAVLILRFSPFSWVNRVLLCFGYFLLFEYGVLVRPYGLTFLFCILFCQALYAKKGRDWKIFVVIFLLANTQTYAFGLGIWMILIWILMTLPERNKTEKGFFWIFLGLSILALIPVLLLILPEEGNAFDVGTTYKPESWKFLAILASLFKAYFPIPHTGISFWNSHFLDDLPRWISGLGGFLCLISVAWSFLKRRKVLLIYLGGTGLFLLLAYLFFDLGFHNNYRHKGHLFIVLFVSAWIYFHESDGDSEDDGQSKYFSIGLTVLLCVHLLGAIIAFSQDLKFPFSNAKETAEYFRNHKYEKLPLINIGDAEMTSIAGFLDCEIYFLSRSKLGSFAIWKPFAVVEEAEIPYKVSEYLRSFGATEAVYLEARPEMRNRFSEKRQTLRLNGANWKYIEEFTMQNTVKENYYIYEVRIEE